MSPPAQKVSSALATSRTYSAGRRTRTKASPTRTRSLRGSRSPSMASLTRAFLPRGRRRVQAGLTSHVASLGCATSMATTSPPTPPRRSSRAAAQERRARAERLLALFAWHRDGPLVARSLGLSLDELHAQLDELKLRRKAYRLARGSDHDLPIAKP